jgi:GGDEF domain-containing protein
LVFTYPLHSPFSAGAPVGELDLGLDRGAIDRQVARTARLFSLALIGMTLVVGGALAVAVRETVLRPITALSSAVHALDAREGSRLGPDLAHPGNVLGQLGLDVNQLVDRLMAAVARGQRLGEELAGEARKLQAILENTGKGIFVLRGDGTLASWTPAFLRLMGGEAPVPGSPLNALFGPCRAQVARALALCLGEGGPVSELLELPEAAPHRWLKLSLDPIGPDWIQGLLEPVDAQHEAADIAQEDLDPPSGVLNRLGAERAIGEALANQAGLGLMMVGLDGAEAPPEVLREAARRMTAALWPTDRVARLNGSEFLLILGGLRDESQALAIAHRVVQALAPPFPGDEARRTPCVGITLLDPGEEPFRHVLLKRAGLALAEARQGREPCRVLP